MKKELMDILACPICKGPMELAVEEENKDEVFTGVLRCAKCFESYPIQDSIPNLIPRNPKG